MLAASIGATAAAVGALAWQALGRPRTLAQERPVAVRPFADLGVDPAQAWCAEAIEDLARLPDTLVIAQASARHDATGAPPDLRLVARDLDVRFVLVGSVARADPQVACACRSAGCRCWPGARRCWPRAKPPRTARSRSTPAARRRRWGWG